VQCTPHGGFGEDFWVFEIKDTSTNVINVIESNDVLKVYPNPAKDYVLFAFTEIKGFTQNKTLNSSTVITVFDFYGRKINNPVIYYTDDKTVWDTREVQNGIYFYILETEGESYSGKVVIQKK
jgi:hypothetical protein